MHDLRIENSLFNPHLRNGSYKAFFEQSTTYTLDEADTCATAGSFWQLETLPHKHPILDLESEVSRILAQMEVTGVFVDAKTLHELDKVLTKIIAEIEFKIHHEASALSDGRLKIEDGRLNLSSPKQLQDLLFETMKIKPIRKTKTGWSVDEETLTILAEEHEICRDILTHRHASKLLSTYVRGLMKSVNPGTGRIHTTYDTLGASTGRLSSNDPNLQNIPSGDVWSDKIKEAFRPEDPDWSFVVADYSQIELRILACLSGDKTMIDTFIANKDLHYETAKFLFGKDDITKAERSMAKTVNFGVIYGITPYGLSKMLGKPPADCAIYISRFFELYPTTKQYFDHIVAETKKVGFAETFFGRRRAIKGLTDKNSIVREQARREAMNMPNQGTCADIIKFAMVAIDGSIREKGLKARMLLQVHDELVVECPDEEIDEVTNMLHQTMEHVVEWDVPLKVDIGSGKNWLSAKG